MLRDQINQSVYYTANRISQQDVTNEEANELLDIQEDSIDEPQATLDQMIEFAGLHNVKEIWAITFTQNMITLPNNSPIPYLYLFREERADFREENITTFEQRIVYGKLHSMYKKALNKALENKKRKGKGRPLGTKRLKSSHEAVKPKVKQQCRCKRCGNVGHYQKNCKYE
ncbi:15508_t:CDS:2 [Cetraspora pellucida]|uniref:15508_t:CDS:1 n=1 Tax=Cetraspora pellucida TaxID=1433469 RepID=A0ACA9P190_9GLOM|nr:15508_t:CDS:2 [Cetraspora pellucida]